jgi:hypothetical protein
MGKNSQLHLVLETSLLNSLKLESEGKGMNFSEFCRNKLRSGATLERIEKLLLKLLENGTK